MRGEEHAVKEIGPHRGEGRILLSVKFPSSRSGQ